MAEEKECCKKNGVSKGLMYGLIPHAGCIAFIALTVLGMTAATTLLQPMMLNPYFFYMLIALSFVLATASAAVYLKRGGSLSRSGARSNWKYLATLYSTTIAVNLVMFLVIFPYAANATGNTSTEGMDSLRLQVNIPCSGHASLIKGELMKVDGVKSVRFDLPNIFEVGYDATTTSKEKIMSIGIFKDYPAKEVA